MDAKTIRSDQALSDLMLLMRNYRGALRKLEKAKGHNNRLYWTQAIKHWEGLIDRFLENREPSKPVIRELVDQFKANLSVLGKELPRVIVDDLDYRFDAIVDTLLADGLQVNALKEENSKIIER